MPPLPTPRVPGGSRLSPPPPIVAVYKDDVAALLEGDAEAAVIVLVPVRLGGERLNPVYVEGMKVGGTKGCAASRGGGFHLRGTNRGTLHPWATGRGGMGTSRVPRAQWRPPQGGPRLYRPPRSC